MKAHPYTLLDRRAFVHCAAGAAAFAARLSGRAEPGPEWRNRAAGMAYRALGRTGMMISEVICGGDPVRDKNYLHLNLALEMGLNYLDMAPSYGNGECERTYGKLLQGSSRREKVFLTTKVSALNGRRNALYKEIFDRLPGGKQAEIMERARRMVAERQVDKHGYFFEYYPGQRNQFADAYRSNAMMEEFGPRVENSPQLRQAILQSVEDSLRRVGTDYFDILMCPHGGCCPEELHSPEILRAFQDLKKQGKVRFLGVTSHNDPAGVLSKAAALGHYDVAMVAYNVINGGYLEQPIREAVSRGMGVIAMKVAMAVATHHRPLQPTPQWRIDKVNRLVPGDMKPPVKAYLWALQNPNVSAVISNLWDETHVRENLGVAGKKIELQPA
jgi:aryl-alcohol dehydrogenase-like predicted oxidoreductase